MDPVVIFLLIAVPVLAGTTVHLHLGSKRIAASLRRESLVKWYLHGFTKTCLAEADPQAVREALAETLIRLVGPRAVRIYELNSQSNRLELLHQLRVGDRADENEQGYVLDEGIPRWVMQNRKPVILNDLSLELSHQVAPRAMGMGFSSFAAIPLMAREKPLGLITMYSSEPNFFDDSKVLLAQILADVYGLSLESLP